MLKAQLFEEVNSNLVMPLARPQGSMVIPKGMSSECLGGTAIVQEGKGNAADWIARSWEMPCDFFAGLSMFIEGRIQRVCKITMLK